MMFIGLILTATAIVIIVSSILTWVHRKPGITGWRPIMTNPFNWVFMPDLLTETGLKYRKAALSAWALFIGIFALTALLDGFGLLPD